MLKHTRFALKLLLSALIGAFLGVLAPIFSAADLGNGQVSALPTSSTNISTYIPLNLPAPKVPFYSQFTDVQSSNWRNKACGITSLAMLIEFYHPETVSVQKLLNEGIAAGAYITNAGWSHQGLALLAKKYDLNGKTYDLSKSGKEIAFTELKKLLKEGPVIASVHYKLDPKNPIPHLIVINGIEGDTIYYNDPAAKSGDKGISVDKFIQAWKKRLIVVRPKKNQDVSLNDKIKDLQYI